MQINFDRFELGIDLRKDAAVSDANRLREMKNAYVTTGLTTAKRPGFSKVCTLEPGTSGLCAALGKLHTFYGKGSVTHENKLFEAHKVAPTDGEKDVKDLWYADVFNNYMYVAVEYADGTVRHHYLDGSSTTQITDEKCPHSKACMKLKSKLFAVGKDGDVVRFCAAGRPRDWSTSEDAGFLPTGMNARGDRTATALGTQQGYLAVLTRDSCQLWNVDPDPNAMGLYDTVENVGSTFPKTVANVSGDLYFLSDYGVRSVTTQAYTENLVDEDVGSPIDTMVKQAIAQAEADDIAPKSFYFYGTGQYILSFGNHLFVYSISRTAKISAWSHYYLNFKVDAVAELGKKLYFRSGDDIYVFDEDIHTDGGIPFETLIELPYMDFKKPGQLKQVLGIDAVVQGSCFISVGFDSRDPDAWTPEVLITGNTRPGGTIPIPCCGTEISLRIRNFDDKPFKLNALTVYYNLLGVR